MFVIPEYYYSDSSKVDHNLEKNLKSFICKYGKGANGIEIDLWETYENFEKKRGAEEKLMLENIQQIGKLLRNKVSLVTEKKFHEINDFAAFKEEMISIQENIIQLKVSSKSNLKTLTNLEEDLNDELEMYFNVKLPEWCENINIPNTELVLSRTKIKHVNHCEEIQRFFDFLHQSGGHENGWRKEDHLLFLKMRKKHKDINDLAKNLHDTLPDLTIEEIKSHEEWYKIYCKLELEKKKAISQWRQNKNERKCTKSLVVDNKDEDCRKEVDVKKLRKKLLEWKCEKEEKQLFDQEIEKQKTMERIEKERMKKLKQMEIRKIVNEWRQSKTVLEQSEKLLQKSLDEMEKRRRQANANKLIKQFRSLDELHILKLKKIHKKVYQEPQCKNVKTGSVPAVTRDPKRLLKPTIQWAQRVRANREPAHSAPLLLTLMPKLAVPDWRKNVS
ncbi:hypothetical protein ABEB36_004551 [Hypothenemus hampei]|uniref:Coiled-coil domain-containing protein 112 n=1 Tax=Hypothenemus hampei TaxID=57062 RepID=A0ABD1F3N5_HYPHA